MNTFIYISEYEQIIIFVLLIFLFLFGLKKKKENLLLDGFRIDKNFSGALKGIACILILMSHYEQMMHPRIPGTPNTISFIIANTAANVALVWFMFISGYGLTVSKNNLIGTRAHLKGILTRCSKVFFPMLFVFVGSLLLFVVLPNEISLAEHAIPQEFYMLKSQLPFDYGVILFAPIKWYWYVWCILCYYVFFLFFPLFINKIQMVIDIYHAYLAYCILYCSL